MVLYNFKIMPSNFSNNLKKNSGTEEIVQFLAQAHYAIEMLTRQGTPTG